MGVLNVTPDSFSDGGLFLDKSLAIERGLRLVSEGADLVDVGGESTRPGAESVPEEEELRRVLPVVVGLVAQGVTVSIDTSKPVVAREAVAAGAVVVNDVTGLRDAGMRAVVAGAYCNVCVMHLRGNPRTMQAQAMYADVLSEVRHELLLSLAECEADGIAPGRLWIDPGLGFAKNVQQNLELLRRLPELVALGYPVLVGASRKSFLGKVLGSEEAPLPVGERLEGTLAAHMIAQIHGAKVLRAHDVLASRRTIDFVAAVSDVR